MQIEVMKWKKFWYMYAFKGKNSMVLNGGGNYKTSYKKAAKIAKMFSKSFNGYCMLSAVEEPKKCLEGQQYCQTIPVSPQLQKH